MWNCLFCSIKLIKKIALNKIYQPPKLQVKLEATKNVLSGTLSQSTIEKFIQDELHGIVGYRTSANAKDFKSPIVIVYYNIDFVKDLKGL